MIYQMHKSDKFRYVMQLNELKILFDAGALKSASVIECHSTGDYYLLIKKCDGQSEVFDSQRSPRRMFKTIDSAVKAAVRIGFTSLNFKIDK